MVKCSKRLSALVCALTFGGAASAATAKTTSEVTTKKAEQQMQGTLNVRYIDSIMAMQASTEGQKVTGELEKMRKELGDELQSRGKTLETAMKSFEAKKSTMSEKAQEDEMGKVRDMQWELEKLTKQYEEKFKVAMQRATERLAKQVEDVAQKLAKAENLDAVIDKSTGRVLYTSDKADLTEQLVVEMNKMAKTTTVA